MDTRRNACEAVESWPRLLAEMRSLTKCFRNEDCRVTIPFYFRTLGQNADAPFRSFTPGFAKWRLCASCFLGAFQNTKLEGLDEACKDVELWYSGDAVLMTQSCYALGGSVGQNICFL